MKVLHILNSPGGGGASICAQRFIQLSKEAGTGIEHYIAISGGSQPTEGLAGYVDGWAVVPLRTWHKQIRLQPIPRFLSWMRMNQVTRFGNRSKDQIAELIRKWKIDLVHTNTGLTPDGAYTAKRIGIPHVWHIRESLGSQGLFPSHYSDKWLAEEISALSSTVITVSNYTAKIFVDNGLPDKVKVIYDPVDYDRFNSLEAKEAGRLLQNDWGCDSQLVIAMVASVTATLKQHDLFIKAVGELQKQNVQAKYVIVGNLPRAKSSIHRGGMDYYLRLKQLEHSLGLEGKILWVGDCPDISAVMNAIDILVHPCEKEGFGMVAVEAMAVGKPVVGPSSGGIGESIRDRLNGRAVSPGNVKQFATAIQELLTKPQLADEYGANGKSYVREKFSTGEYLQRMVEVFHHSLTAGVQ